MQIKVGGIFMKLIKLHLFLASFLAGRSWQGLEPKLGETPVVKAVKGRRGIAIAYEKEGTSWRFIRLFIHLNTYQIFKYCEGLLNDFLK